MFSVKLGLLYLVTMETINKCVLDDGGDMLEKALQAIQTYLMMMMSLL